MILGFKEDFIPKILDDSKIHTLRDGERWKEGMSIQYFGKVRQKGMYKFKQDGMVISTQDVVIWLYRGKINLCIDGNVLKPEIVPLFIKKDGFDSEKAFIDFFFDSKIKTRQIIKKQLVHWTDFKY